MTPNSTTSQTLDTKDTPSIYVACLAAYNSGKLHGAWIDATQDPEAIREAIQTMLAASPEPDAEEWAVHDYDSFYGLPLSEWESIDDIHVYASFIEEHGKLGAHILAHTDYDPDQATIMMEERYVGCYTNAADFAQELTRETTQIPENLFYYIDYESMAYDMELNGDILTFELSHDDIHIFWTC